MNCSPGMQSRKDSCGPHSVETTHSGEQQSETLQENGKSKQKIEDPEIRVVPWSMQGGVYDFSQFKTLP